MMTPQEVVGIVGLVVVLMPIPGNDDRPTRPVWLLLIHVLMRWSEDNQQRAGIHAIYIFIAGIVYTFLLFLLAIVLIAALVPEQW